MAESMQGLKRTHRCGELSAVNVGETVTIMGWVQKNRNKGGLVFTDVRDRSGIIQVVCEEGTTDAGSDRESGSHSVQSMLLRSLVEVAETFRSCK